MRFKPLVMIFLAVVFGGSAMMAGNAWLKRQASARMPVEAARSSAPSTTTLVVASSQLRYGDEITPLKLRQVAWPEGNARLIGLLARPRPLRADPRSTLPHGPGAGKPHRTPG